MVNYQNAIIYKICCKDANIKEIYIGSTTSFKARKCSHKYKCYAESSRQYNQKNYKFIRDNGGWDNWDIIQIKTFPCNSKRELETEERKIIEEMKPELNSQIPTRTVQEYAEDHKENIKEYRHQYYLNELEELKKKITCDCGSTYQTREKYRHLKTIKHKKFIKSL
jgi:hypothetical protein